MRVPKRPRLSRDLGCDGHDECRWASSAHSAAHDLPDVRQRPAWKYSEGTDSAGQFQELRRRNDTPSDPSNTESNPASLTADPNIPTNTATPVQSFGSASVPEVQPTSDIKTNTVPSESESQRPPNIPSDSVPTDPITTPEPPQIPTSTAGAFVPPALVTDFVSTSAPVIAPPAIPLVSSVIATVPAILSSVVNGPNVVPAPTSIANPDASVAPEVSIVPKLRTAATGTTAAPVVPAVASVPAVVLSSAAPLVAGAAPVVNSVVPGVASVAASGVVNGASSAVNGAVGVLSTAAAGVSSLVSNVGGVVTSVAGPLESQVSSLLPGQASASAESVATTTTTGVSTSSTPQTTSLSTLTDSTSFVVISGSTVSTEFHTTVTSIPPVVTGGSSNGGAGGGSGSGSGGAANGGQSSGGTSAGDISGSGDGGSDKSNPSISSPVVVGGVVGGLAGLAVLLLLVLLLLRWRKNTLRRRIGSGGGLEAERLHSAFDDEPEGRSKNPFAAVAALISSAALFHKLKPHGEKSAGESTDRGFFKISGRRVDPAVTISSMSAAAATAGTDSSHRDANRPLTPVYRDSHSFFAGDVSPETREITTPIRPFPQNLRAAPAPPTRSARQGTPTLDPFVDNFSFPTPPRSRRGPIGIRDGVGRSLPSQDGSRASRFTEEIE